MKNCNHLFDNSVWAIIPERLLAMANIAAADLTIKAQAARQTSTQQNIAYIPLYGVIDQHSSLWMEIFGGTSIDGFAAAFDFALNDSSVSAILIDVDSPGGSVYGSQELSDKIYNSRGRKPVIAVGNALMASAAYYIASAADEIVVIPSGEVGSIGVIAIHMDYSKYDKKVGVTPTIIKAGKYKGEGNPYEPLGADAKDYMQGRIDDYYNDFVNTVARNRGVSVGKVLTDFGQGRLLGAKAAKNVGMIDTILPMDAVIKIVQTRKNTTRRAAASVDQNRLSIEALKL